MTEAHPNPSPPERPAMFFTRLADGVAACGLCPRACRIPPGGVGACHVRRNEGGALVADSYGRPAALQIDPVEKKPLAAYLPGTSTFSIGTFGCNLSCAFCQNHHLSRQGGALQRAQAAVEPEAVVAMARRAGCRSVAFTYNEPTVFIEYAIDIARLARAAGLGTVLVSNGFISPAPRAALYPLIDAANIDVKGFSEAFYSSLCGGSLAPVLESCRCFKRDVCGHLEITNLLIPNRNDSPAMIQALLDWMADAVGRDTPIHFSAYRPMGGFAEPPTPAATVHRAVATDRAMGFAHVVTGNI